MVTLYTIACMRSLVDASSNNISCIEILEEAIPSFPNVFPEAAIIWCIAREADEPQSLPCTFHIFLNDTKLYEAPVEVVFKSSLRTRAMMKLAGLVIPHAGRLRFEFRSAKVSGSWSLEINGPSSPIKPPPIMASAPTGPTH
jgi:hypothetical protein